ncbi:MAG TPA: NUDIX hydrolase [Azospirillaceae bacterium]|nr:NUDIX hydrolase [Azospirillaceae bacterium]
MKKKKKPRTQYAALPFTIRDDQTRVLLVTSRETRRWVIPKGWPEKHVQPHELAAREAYEEAGLVGRVGQRPFASFQYEKRLKSGRTTTCVVQTYLFEVEEELDDWPEKAERERRWMSPAEAAGLVTEGDLGQILLNLENHLPH